MTKLPRWITHYNPDAESTLRIMMSDCNDDDGEFLKDGGIYDADMREDISDFH